VGGCAILPAEVEMPLQSLLEDPAVEGIRSWGKIVKTGRPNAPEAVEAIQEALVALGLSCPTDGQFRATTLMAVRKFQKWAHLDDDGVVGARTLHALQDALDAGARLDTPAAPTPAEGELVRGIYPRDRFPGKIALTFDDGPNPRTTPAILDTLAAAGAKATFFVLGRAAHAHPAIIRRMVEEGHTVGSHSWDHPKLNTLSPDQLDDQLGRTQAAVDAALGKAAPMNQVRPPYGLPFFNTAADQRPKVAAAFKRAGLQNIMWQIDTNDWKYSGNPGGVVTSTEGSLGRGLSGVLLMHDVHTQSRDALPRVIAAIRAKGLDLVTVDSLLQHKYGVA